MPQSSPFEDSANPYTIFSLKIFDRFFRYYGEYAKPYEMNWLKTLEDAGLPAEVIPQTTAGQLMLKDGLNPMFNRVFWAQVENSIQLSLLDDPQLAEEIEQALQKRCRTPV